MTKRFLNCISIYLILAGFLGNFSSVAQEKPNIILFMVDDMGWMDTSLPFGEGIGERNKQFHTPNMERLAKEGMKFTNAYATPVCTPTRVSLMTGMSAAHHQVTNWTSRPRDTPSDYDHENNPLKTPEWNYNGYSPVKGIPHTIYATPLPKLIQDAGYFTIHIGKAHFAPAGTPGSSPYNLGFSVNIGGNMAGMPQSFYGEHNYGNLAEKTTDLAVPDLTEYYGTATYLTEALTLEAIKTLEDPVRRKQPFFMYMSHYAVHFPLQEDPRFAQKYRDAGLEPGAVAYASMIEGMDKSLGDLMDFLKRKKIDQNTIIFFMSDNGGHSLNQKKGGKPHTQNLPLREGKGSVYEGGIREPMIVKWPGTVEPGSKTDEPVIIEDYFPTLLEIVGNESAKVSQQVDGKSFVSLLKGENHSDPERIFTWHFPNKWKMDDFRDIDYLSAIRQGDWKLIYNMPLQNLELYNLKSDIGEQNDLASKYPQRVKKLAKLMSDKFREWGALMPMYKTNGKQVPWADEIKK
jgi:arylsulfatase A-like enzyme